MTFVVLKSVEGSRFESAGFSSFETVGASSKKKRAAFTGVAITVRGPPSGGGVPEQYDRLSRGSHQIYSRL